jgi:hypothetical protein
MPPAFPSCREIESGAFDGMWGNYFDDDEYRALQEFLMLNPAAGVVVPGSAGVRKVRWARGGTGKRGGLRVIYWCAPNGASFGR